MYTDKERDTKVTLEEALAEVDNFPILEGGFIGFVIDRNETIQLTRIGKDQWLIDVPIWKDGRYVYSLQDVVIHSQVKEIVTLFFQGKDWKSLCNLRKPYEPARTPELLRERPYFMAEKYEKEGKITEATQIYWELINNNQMGQHPYNRLRIIYAKRKDWKNAIKTCQKFIDAVKSGNGQLRHPSFKITVKKYEGWIRKYEKKLGISKVPDFHSSEWILAQSIKKSSENAKRTSSRLLPVFNLNDVLPEWAQNEIKFISMDVPPLVRKYPSLKIMNHSNRLYFEKWISHWRNGRPLDVQDYISYLFVYVYGIIENSLPRIPTHFIRHKEKNWVRQKINDDAIKEMLLLQHAYQNKTLFCRYLLTWIFDAYIYNYDYLNAVSYVEYQRNNNLHLKYKDSNYLILSIKYNNKISMSGEDIFQLSNRNWKDITSENEEYVLKYLDTKVKKFERENQVDLLSLITEQYSTSVSSYNYSAFRGTPKSLNVLEITDYHDYSELSDFSRVINDWIKDAKNLVRERMENGIFDHEA